MTVRTNQAPGLRAVQSLTQIIGSAGSVDVSLGNYVSDPDGDMLTYTAVSSDDASSKGDRRRGWERGPLTVTRVGQSGSVTITWRDRIGQWYDMTRMQRSRQRSRRRYSTAVARESEALSLLDPANPGDVPRPVRDGEVGDLPDAVRLRPVGATWPRHRTAISTAWDTSTDRSFGY